MLKIGHGYDVHAFGGANPLILAGVVIEGHLGLVAHSDGDVILHAICDALLGAMCLGDIGAHFPDTSDQYKNIDSRKLLRRVFLLVTDAGAEINNLDITIIAQTPRMSEYILSMRKNIADDLKLSINQVNVKATTTEKLGYIGRKEGVAVHCVCLVNTPASTSTDTSSIVTTSTVKN